MSWGKNSEEDYVFFLWQPSNICNYLMSPPKPKSNSSQILDVGGGTSAMPHPKCNLNQFNQFINFVKMTLFSISVLWCIAAMTQIMFWYYNAVEPSGVCFCRKWEKKQINVRGLSVLYTSSAERGCVKGFKLL